MVEFDLPPQTEKDIENLSEATGQSEEQVIAQAVQNLLVERGRQVSRQQAEQRKQMAEQMEDSEAQENSEE